MQPFSTQDLFYLTKCFPLSSISNGNFRIHPELSDYYIFPSSRMSTKQDVEIFLFKKLTHPSVIDQSILGEYIQAGINQYLHTCFSKDDLKLIGCVCRQSHPEHPGFPYYAPIIEFIKSDYNMAYIREQFSELVKKQSERECERTD